MIPKTNNWSIWYRKPISLVAVLASVNKATFSLFKKKKERNENKSKHTILIK